MSRSAADAYDQLLGRTREVSLLASCGSVLGWDEATYMPHKGSAFRGEQMALLARMGHELATDPVVGDWLRQVEASDLLADPEGDAAVNVREIRRAYDRAVKVPAALVAEIARVTTQAQQSWREARQRSKFALFEKDLRTIVQLLRDKADAIGHDNCRYDALLDEYEPGARAADLTKVFAQLRSELVPLLEQIRGSTRHPDVTLLQRDFPVERQKVFGEAAAAALGFDFEAGRLDVSTHPFCSGIGPGDTRMTTRYNPRQFNESFFGVLHETGHGLYDQGLPPEHVGTPRGSFCSLGIHESQSRLWENQVGRGRPFWEHFFPRLQQTFPTSLAGVSLDDWHFAINHVSPSFIRVEADEATYNLHIILRFEIEQALLTGDLDVADLPAAWNDKFQKMFGLRVESDSQGCLQDIHWSFAGLGYFPPYTLGNLYSAQFMHAVRRDLPTLDADIRRGDFTGLRRWLLEKIHRQGQRFRAGELCRRITAAPLDHRPLMSYLREKYAPLYGF
ncbi:MAG: carboxypeptidase M32 [Gemmataceae bacterium]